MFHEEVTTFGNKQQLYREGERDPFKLLAVKIFESDSKIYWFFYIFLK